MYNINVKIEYENNKQYRQCLRNVFSMDISNLDIPFDQIEDLDDETEDELLFDENAMIKSIDFIYEKTNNNAYFKELYKIAASKMFSEDENIGLAVLFSYDYFASFHLCLVDFLNKNEFNEKNNYYINLKNKIC